MKKECDQPQAHPARCGCETATGEVEVAAIVKVKILTSGSYSPPFEEKYLSVKDIDRLSANTELVDGAHVTRLQAEVEEANDRSFRASEAHVVTMGKLRATQSELTKALELLVRAEVQLRHDEMYAQAEEIKSYLAHQSAPATKDEPNGESS